MSTILPVHARTLTGFASQGVGLPLIVTAQTISAPQELRKVEETAAVLGVTRSVIAGHGGEVRLIDDFQTTPIDGLARAGFAAVAAAALWLQAVEEGHRHAAA